MPHVARDLVLAHCAVSLVTKPTAELTARGRTAAGCQIEATHIRPPAAQKHTHRTMRDISHPSLSSNHAH